MALRIFLLTAWVLAAVGVGVWHLGPGQDYKKLDNAAVQIRAAEAAAAEADYQTAVEKYDAALAALPPDCIGEARRLRLERAKAQMLAKKLPEASGELKSLVDELSADPTADPKLLAEARSAMANSQYYMTWLMRLEGMSQDVWEPEIEAARQNYKLLAEQAEKRGDTLAITKHKEDLEAAIRLARMDLGELQGLPLPSQ